jgi:hypothetical protein
MIFFPIITAIKVYYGSNSQFALILLAFSIGFGLNNLGVYVVDSFLKEIQLDGNILLE